MYIHTIKSLYVQIMNLGSHLDGSKQIELRNILLHILSNANQNTILSALSQIGFNSDIDRIVYMSGTDVKTVATIDDVYDGQGNTTYISVTEPTGIPTIGLIEGDWWYNTSTTAIKLCIDPNGATELDRWTDITDTNITYTLPIINVSTTYPNLSVFVYSDLVVGVSNGNESIWQNQSGSDKSTTATITSESDLVSLGFTKIGGGNSTVNVISIELDSTWADGNHTVGSFTVVKSSNIYTVDCSPSIPKFVSFKRTTTGNAITTDYSINGNVVEVSFFSQLMSNVIVTIFI